MSKGRAGLRGRQAQVEFRAVDYDVRHAQLEMPKLMMHTHKS